MARYIPEQGDIVTITFDPQAGHEQKGRRPALVVSKHLFNKATGLVMVCPISNTDQGFPFHVPLPEKGKVTGFVLVEHIKSLDFDARKIKCIEKRRNDLLEEVLSILDPCIFSS
jgi:mRNA interferase MazF